jgi:hypothetical protein
MAEMPTYGDSLTRCRESYRKCCEENELLKAELAKLKSDRRLGIAAMAMQGILANSYHNFDGVFISSSEVMDLSFCYADTLIAGGEKPE